MKNLSSNSELDSNVDNDFFEIFPNGDRTKSYEPTKRRSMIISMPERNLNVGESMYLNEIILFESKPILKKRGQKFSVKMGKSDKRTFKTGHCYSNSVNKVQEGYRLVDGQIKKKDGFSYVEGYIKDKDGYIISHSWNVDSEGNHFDFTFKDPEEYKYFGIVIPDDKVLEVGEKNGHIWYCILPFVDNDFNYKEDF